MMAGSSLESDHTSKQVITIFLMQVDPAWNGSNKNSKVVVKTMKSSILHLILIMFSSELTMSVARSTVNILTVI